MGKNPIGGHSGLDRPLKIRYLLKMTPSYIPVGTPKEIQERLSSIQAKLEFLRGSL